MTSQKGFLLVRLLILLLAFVSMTQPSRADSIFDIAIDTRPLAGMNAQLAFDLTRGDGATNSISILGFTTDATVGAATSMGGPAIGGLPGATTLGDGEFFNELLQDLTLGDSISFRLSLTENFAGPTPAEFSLFMLDPATGLPLFSTSDPTGADALFALDITGAAFGQYEVFNSVGSGPAATLSATPFTTPPPPAPVPEPSSFLLFGTGVAALAACRFWKRGNSKATRLGGQIIGHRL